MRQIIVPTDFSVPAENAMLFAGGLAQKMNAGILLVHVFQIPVAMSDVPVMMVSADDLKQNADKGLEKTAEVLQKAFPDIAVQTESRMGGVTDELNDLCKEIKPFAIVIGKHGAGGIERFFFGSTSLSVVRHTNIPVIVVPEATTRKDIRSVALAVDDQTEMLPKEAIKNITDALSLQLHVIHVQSGKTETKNLNQLVSGLSTTCKTIRDDEVLHGIQTYLTESNIDMLMIIPHKHSFMERLTFRTHTEELLRKLTIPIICIAEG